MTTSSVETVALRDAIDILMRHAVPLLITKSKREPYHFELEGAAVTETDIVARAMTCGSESLHSSESDKQALARAHRRNHYTLLSRAVRILAQHGIPVLVTSRGDRCDFEIDDMPVREIDVIVRAAMIDVSLLAERRDVRAYDDQRAA